MNTVIFDGAPIAPSKIICAGRNYAAHIAELGNEVPTEPVFFIKPNSSITDTLRAASSEPHHYESEICFLIAGNRLAGVGFGLDLTRRQLQSRLKQQGLPWERAKAFDGAALFSEFIPFDGDFADLRLTLHIDGELQQQGGVDLMLHAPDVLLSDAITFLHFEDGDILMTGTPAGVGPIRTGSEYVGSIWRNDQRLLEVLWTAH